MDTPIPARHLALDAPTAGDVVAAPHSPAS